MKALIKCYLDIDKSTPPGTILSFIFDYYNFHMMTPLEDNSLITPLEDNTNIYNRMEARLDFHLYLIQIQRWLIVRFI